MKKKDKYIVLVHKIIFGLLLTAVLVFLIFGEMLMPKENPTDSGTCTIYEGDWTRVYPNGNKTSIEIPTTCDAKRGEVVRLETVLPQSQQAQCFAIRASQQDMRIYVDEQLRKEYTTKGTRLFGNSSASAYVFFEISPEDSGKVLTIEQTSKTEYSGFINEVYVGDKYDISMFFVKECAGVLFVSLCMFIVSFITVFSGCVMRIVYRRKVDITYLGLGILQLSLAMITESRVRQFFLPNGSIASHVGFLLTMLVPYPFIVYVCRLQNDRYIKFYKRLSQAVAINFLLSITLQIAGVVDLTESTVAAYALIAIMIIAFAVTICMDIKKGRIGEYGEVIIGIVVMIFVTVWEMYVTFYPESTHYGGVVLSYGLILLLFVAGIKTAREMLEVEREKQSAIAAGAAKSRFLANMSHEIRTPINTIIGMNEMILRENNDSAIEEYAQSVQSASKLLLGLVNDVLDFSKIEAGKLEIIETEYNLSKLLHDVVEGIKPRAQSKNLKLEVLIENHLPAVLKGDEIRIRQILNNLLSNAVKYTKEGTVTLKIKGIREEERFLLHIAVKDTGIGIKEEDLKKLFSRFQRLEEEKNRYIEGTGLGLNITRQLAELMGGNVEVSSIYGEGSCFTVIIPQEIVRQEEIKENRKGLYAPTAEILVVDDNQMNLMVLGALLKRTAVKLTKAHGGLECLDLCKKNKYDLILMDHMMPDPDGIETLHLLRKDKESLNRNTEVIVLTANAIAGMSDMYIAEGFNDYLSKPVVAEDLEEMLGKHLPAEKIEFN